MGGGTPPSPPNRLLIEKDSVEKSFNWCSVLGKVNFGNLIMTTTAVREILELDHNIDNQAFAGLFTRKQISSDPIMSILDIEYNELLRVWKHLQDYITASDRVDFQPRLQQANDVLRIIHFAQEIWRNMKPSSTIRALMPLSERFSATIESHSVILCPLPDYRLYCSVLYGVIQTIIKASINHPRVAVGFLKSLVEINETIPLSLDVWHQHPALFNQRVSKLYSRIFLFLGEFSDAYIKKTICRLLDSHNEDFYLEFENFIQSVKASARAVLWETRNPHVPEDVDVVAKRKHVRRTSSDLLEESRLQKAGLEGANRRNVAQTTITRQIICDIQRYAATRTLMKAQRAAILADLQVNLTSQLHSDDNGFQTSDSMGTSLEGTSKVRIGFESPPPGQGPMHRLTKSSLLYASRNLQDSFSNDAQDYDSPLDTRLTVDPRVIGQLGRWMRSIRSEVISVSGPHTVALPNDIKLIAACCVTLARREHIPVVAHFCSLPTHQPRHGLTGAQHALIALGYSFIRQLIEIGPPALDCDSTCDLSAERFNRFDGTMSSWSEVVSVLDSLLYFAPPILLFVVDGLELLEDPSTSEHIRSLLDVLISHTLRPPTSVSNQNMSPQKVLMKVLFTGAGRSEIITATLDEPQMVMTESVRVEHVSPDRILDGEQDVDMLES